MFRAFERRYGAFASITANVGRGDGAVGTALKAAGLTAPKRAYADWSGTEHTTAARVWTGTCAALQTGSGMPRPGAAWKRRLQGNGFSGGRSHRDLVPHGPPECFWTRSSRCTVEYFFVTACFAGSGALSDPVSRPSRSRLTWTSRSAADRRAPRRSLWEGVELDSTPLLVRLAASLASRPGEIVPIAVLLEEVWGDHMSHPSKVHRAIWRLRQALGIDHTSSFLVGKRGIGYGIFPEMSAVRSSSWRSSWR